MCLCVCHYIYYILSTKKQTGAILAGSHTTSKDSLRVKPWLEQSLR